MIRLDPVCVENPAAKNTRAERRRITIQPSEHHVDLWAATTKFVEFKGLEGLRKPLRVP
jgi:hypothetical protein